MNSHFFVYQISDHTIELFYDSFSPQIVVSHLWDEHAREFSKLFLRIGSGTLNNKDG